MSHWEKNGESNEWYTPKYIFDALGVVFDLDVAHPANAKTNVPCKRFISEGSLNEEWNGFVWCNPPFGGRNGLSPWIDKFIDHGNGVFLSPDRTSTDWWQKLALKTDVALFIKGNVKFERKDGSVGMHPSTGTCLFAVGESGYKALINANSSGLGLIF